MALELNEKNFQDEIANAKGLALVDFWAPWCGPCRKQLPIVEELAVELFKKVKIGKVNTDENQGLAGVFGVQSIPTLFIFKDGKAVEMLSGVHSKSQLLEAIGKHE